MLVLELLHEITRLNDFIGSPPAIKMYMSKEGQKELSDYIVANSPLKSAWGKDLETKDDGAVLFIDGYTIRFIDKPLK